MKRLAEKIAVLGTENSKGQFVKIKISVQTQRAKEFQKSRANAKGEHISRTGQYSAKPGGERQGPRVTTMLKLPCIDFIIYQGHDPWNKFIREPLVKISPNYMRRM